MHEQDPQELANARVWARSDRVGQYAIRAPAASRSSRYAHDITLLVCTTGRATLSTALESIAALEVPDGSRVEVLLVNNGGGDPSIAAAAKNLDLCRPELQARVLVEPCQGVAHARKRGIAAAAGELVAFADDDCMLAEDWLRELLDFAAEHPGAGVIGGRNELVFAEEPSPLVLAYGESLARQDWGVRPFRVDADDTRCPCGAGLVFRRAALLQSGWLARGRLVGRHLRRPGAGEDTEAALMVRDAGWEVWYAPQLRLRHLVEPGRTSLRHLLWLHYGFGRAAIYLRLLGRRLPLDSANRLRGVGWAVAELGPILRRFWVGFVREERERPTWLIRLAWAAGCLSGATALLVRGRVD